MNKCFKCQQETAKSGEVYYRFNKLDENGSPTGFDGFTDENSRNIFCCQNCWNNHEQQILKDDNITQVSREQNNLHKIVFDRQTKQKIRNKDNWNGYKCLNCGKIETELLNQNEEIEINHCNFCQSKSLEIKIDGPLGHAFGSFHFSIYECPQCHLYKDIKFHDLSGQESQQTKSKYIEGWKQNKVYCDNSSHELNPRIRNNSSNIPYSNNPSTNLNQNPNKFNLKSPLAIGLISVSVSALIIGLTVYFAKKGNKK